MPQLLLPRSHAFSNDFTQFVKGKYGLKQDFLLSVCQFEKAKLEGWSEDMQRNVVGALSALIMVRDIAVWSEAEINVEGIEDPMKAAYDLEAAPIQDVIVKASDFYCVLEQLSLEDADFAQKLERCFEPLIKTAISCDRSQDFLDGKLVQNVRPRARGFKGKALKL